MLKHWQGSDVRRRRRMLYKIIPDTNSNGQMSVSDKFLTGSPAVRRKSVSLKCGSRTIDVDLIKDSRLKVDEVKLSRDLFEELLLLEGIEYQIIVEQGCLKLGPIIGLLMANNKASISKNSLSKLMNYTLIYPQIGGLLVAFSTDSIDLENKCIQGYCYNPQSGRKGLPWHEGTFPLPNTIFSRALVSEDMILKLKKETNNCFFNSCYFNKWEFYKMISKNRTYSEYIPYTKLVTGINEVEEIATKYGAAYLKPINGTLSRGLYKVTKVGDDYGIQGKQGGEVQLLSSEEAKRHIYGIIKGHKYIAQQSITPLKVNGRHMDFRVIMQKDQTLDWQCTGIVALIGGRGDICTNWGNTSAFEDIFYKVFNLSQLQIYKKKREVIGACKGICKILDSTGENYGDLGFDIVIDENYSVWVLEANKRHYHSVPLWINDVQTFYQTKSNPIKYAAAQAGFRVY